MNNKSIDPNLIFLTAVIFVFIAIMIACEFAFHDNSIFTLFVGFVNLLMGILIGAFKNVFHLSDKPDVPQGTQEPKP